MSQRDNILHIEREVYGFEMGPAWFLPRPGTVAVCGPTISCLSWQILHLSSGRIGRGEGG